MCGLVSARPQPYDGVDADSSRVRSRPSRELIEGGKIAVAIDRTYPLSDVPAAIRHVIDGQARGKVVIVV